VVGALVFPNSGQDRKEGMPVANREDQNQGTHMPESRPKILST